MTINEIEVLTEKCMEILKNDGKAELMDIKGHNCYFVDLDGNWGYSVLVFKNNHHIYYANDYQLHHSSKTKEELKTWYIRTLNNKLYTEAELMEEIQTYYEYQQKSHYVRNYWIMQYDYVSAFHIGGEEDKEFKKAKKGMIFCPACFCYVKDKNVPEMAGNLLRHIEKSFAKAKKGETVFREMISYELENHEAGYTCDYTDALDSLDLKFEKLTETQKQIVTEELRKQMDRVC